MKKIGLVGGITWHSTLEYYRAINSETAARRGPLHSAPILLASLEFQHVDSLNRQGREEDVFAIFRDAALVLKQGGAQLLALCANTAHRRAARLEDAVGLPLVHIADATASAVRKAGMEAVGLLGTARTMTEPFLKDRLAERHGLRVLVPDAPTTSAIDRLIFEEMAAGVFSAHAKQLVQQACTQLAAAGAQGVILGCTELPLLMSEERAEVPLFDTTELHATAIVDAALAPD